MVMATVAVPMATVATVVGGNCGNGNDGSGVDGGGDDGSCSDGKCNGSSSGNGDSDGSGKPMKTMAATAMAVGGNTTIN
jgi:hypothetical protein